MVIRRHWMVTLAASLAFTLTGMCTAAPAYETPEPVNAVPEYTEIPSPDGPIILKRDFKSEQQNVIQPLSCIYVSGTIGGGVGPNTFVVAYGPYSTSCVGGHTFTRRSVLPNSFGYGIALQVLSGSTWVTVDSGPSSISYLNAPTGTYRLIATNTTNGIKTHSIDYSIP